MASRTKKATIKVKETELDDDFDIDFLDDIDFDESSNKKDRNPVTSVLKGAYQGVKETITDYSFIRDALDHALPDSYQPALAALDKTTNTASQLYDQAVKEIKPKFKELSRKIDKLVPENSKKLKKIADLLAEATDSRDEGYRPKSADQYKEEMIADNLSKIFQAQAQAEDVRYQEDKGRKVIEQQIEMKRFGSTIQALTSIDNNIAKLQAYEQSVTNAFQKKSLELQYRQLYAVKETNETLQKYYSIFERQNEAIAKNTALPEFTKIQKSERFAEMTRDKFIGGIQDTLFGDQSQIGQALENIKKDAEEFFSEIGDVGSFLSEMADMGDDLKEARSMMKEIDDAEKEYGKEAAKALLSLFKKKFIDKAGGKVPPGVKKWFDKKGKLLSSKLRNIGGIASDRQSQGIKDDSFIEDATMYVTGLFNRRKASTVLGRDFSEDKLKVPAIFNDKTQLSITEIIPGYLARIHREILSLRTGDPAAEMVYYDYKTGIFKTKTKIASDIKSSIKKNIDTSWYSEEIEGALETLIGKNGGESQDSKDEIRQLLLQASTRTMEYSAKNIRSMPEYSKLSPEAKESLDRALRQKLEKGIKNDENYAMLTKKLMNAKAYLPDMRADFQRAANAGQSEILEELGLIEIDEDGRKIINMDKYKSLLAQGVIKSDQDAKTDIKPIKPGTGNIILDKFRKLKNYLWKYKKGQGTDEQMSGPMAQDVNKHFGEETAPDGKSINLTNMNAANLEAIKALDNKTEELSNSDSSRSILSSMNKTVRNIYALMLRTTRAARGSKRSSIAFDLNQSFEQDRQQDSSSSNPLYSKEYIDDLVKAVLKANEIAKNKAENLAQKAGSISDEAASIASASASETLKRAQDYISKIKAKMTSDQETDSLQSEPIDMQNIESKASTEEKSKNPFVNLLRDLRNIGQLALDKSKQQRDKYYPPIKEKATEIYQNRDKYLATLKETAIASVMKLVETVTDVGSRVLFGVKEGFKLLPDIISTVKNKAINAKNKIAKFLNLGVFDIYVGAETEPRIKANLINLGFYRDKLTGKVIETWKDITGPVVDIEGNMILSTEDISKGLFDKNGMPISSLTKKIAGKIRNIGRNILGQVKSKAPKIFDSIKKWTGDVLDSDLVKNSLDNLKKLMSFEFGRSYGVLVQIRDYMYSRWGGAPKNNTENKNNEEEDVRDTQTMDMFADQQDDSNENKTPEDRVKERAQEILSRNEENKPQEAKPDTSAKYNQGGLATAIISAVSNPKEKKDEENKTDENKTETTEETKKPGLFGKIKEFFKKKDNKPKEERTFNDRDGSGDRDNSVNDRTEELKAREEERKKIIADNAANVDTSAKYNQGGMLSKIMGMFTGPLGKVTDLIGNFFSGGGVLGKFFGSLGKGSMIASLGGKLISTLTSGILGAFKLLPGAAGLATTIGTALGKTGITTALTKGAIGVAGSLIKGAGILGLGALKATVLTAGASLLGAAAATLGAVASIVTSPIVIGAAAAAGIGYGIYKGVKYLTRNSADDYQKFRFAQYGFTDSERDQGHYHKLKELEDYIVNNGFVLFENGQPIISKKVDPKRLLEIFSIDAEKEDEVTKYMTWFQKRFKPFLLTNIAALFAVDNKIKITDVQKLDSPQKIKDYMEMAIFHDGPYNERTSPIKDIPELSDTKGAAEALFTTIVTRANDKISQEASKTRPDGTRPNPRYTQVNTMQQRSEDNVKAAKDLLEKTRTSPGKAVVASQSDDGDFKPKVVPNKSNNAGINKLTVASGALRDGSSGMQFLNLAKDVNLDGMHPAFMKNFLAMAQEYGEITGKKITITEAFRTYEQQARLHAIKGPDGKSKAAPPGNSLHEFGLAIDGDREAFKELEELGLMRKYGFTRPVGQELWHVEPSGIQLALSKARQDPNFATQAIEASLGRGGGGYALDPSARKYGRNPELAKSILLNKGGTPVDTESRSVANQTVAEVNVALNKLNNDSEGTGRVDASPSKPVVSATRVSTGSVSQAMTPSLPTVTDMEKPNSTSISAVKNAMSSTSTSQGVSLADNDLTRNITAKPVSTDRQAVKDEIAKAANKAGMDPSFMQTIAAIESSLNPNAKASTSSAEGPFQFLDGTWFDVLKRHGSKYGLDKNADKKDITASTLMASEYFKQNTKHIQDIKPNPNITDLYLTHFLGPGGAKTFLSYYVSNPNSAAADIMPKAANANKSIFYDKSGNKRTFAQVYELISNKVTKTANSFGINISDQNVKDQTRDAIKKAAESSASPEMFSSSIKTPSSSTTVTPSQTKPTEETMRNTFTPRSSTDSSVRSSPPVQNRTDGFIPMALPSSSAAKTAGDDGLSSIRPLQDMAKNIKTSSDTLTEIRDLLKVMVDKSPAGLDTDKITKAISDAIKPSEEKMRTTNTTRDTIRDKGLPASAGVDIGRYSRTT